MVAQLPEVAIHNIAGRTVLLGRKRLFVLLERRTPATHLTVTFGHCRLII